MKDELRKRVALYIRVSSDEQAKEGLSLQAQKNALMNYCEMRGWWVYKHYEDAGKSGGSGNRPAFQQMLKDAKSGKFSGILVTKFDRAFRDTVSSLLLLDDLHKNRIDFISISENIDTTSAMGKAMFTMISAFAELERSLAGDRNKTIMRDKFERGIHPGKPPFGYRLNKNRKVLELNKPRSKIVEKIFNFRVEGMSPSKIAREVNKGTQSILNILKNKIYIGYIQFEGEEKKGIHQPIISQKVWGEVNLV